MAEEGKKERVDVGDAESVGKQKRDANAREARKKIAFRALLNDPAGREWMWDLMKECYIFNSTFTGNAETYLREGKRNVGLKLLADIMLLDPNIFATMMKENGQ